uniref:MHC class I-like antigen recognition-like domain-containing protein n=1 Tax=Amphiprion ocellaris TaxID=80972 RepID=A0A3Q1BQ27_AMPOC
MRSICRVKPDERPIFSQSLFQPPSPCFPLSYPISHSTFLYNKNLLYLFSCLPLSVPLDIKWYCASDEQALQKVWLPQGQLVADLPSLLSSPEEHRHESEKREEKLAATKGYWNGVDLFLQEIREGFEYDAGREEK